MAYSPLNRLFSFLTPPASTYFDASWAEPPSTLKPDEPQKVVLFGSLVRGEIKPGTDIDLFIVKSDVPKLGVDRIRELDALVRYRLATDFVVYTPEEVEHRLLLGDPFVKSILEEGRVLYDAAVTPAQSLP